MNQNLKRDFMFSEWDALSFEEKREIWNHYWDPLDPNVGKKTRAEIISKFKLEYQDISDQALGISYGYFGFYTGAIAVIMKDGKVRVPRHFSDILINKGTVLEKIEDNKYLVSWRDVGGKSEFSLNNNV